MGVAARWLNVARPFKAWSEGFKALATLGIWPDAGWGHALPGLCAPVLGNNMDT